MNLFGARPKQLLRFLTDNAERNTLDYVLREMREVLGDEMPEEDAVRTYLKDPDKPAALSTAQQIVAMNKLLECAEVNFRMLCDLIRYQMLKEAEVTPWRNSCSWLTQMMSVIFQRRMLIEKV